MSADERELWVQRVNLWRGIATRFSIVVYVESAAIIVLVLSRVLS